MHGPVQKLLVEQDAVDVLEQDAVDVLHCGTTQKKRLFGPGDDSAVLIIVLHTSSVLVTVHQKKKAKINSARKIISAHVWHFPGIRGSFAGCRSFLPEFQVEIKNASL